MLKWTFPLTKPALMLRLTLEESWAEGTVNPLLEAAASINFKSPKVRLQFKGGLYLRAASNTTIQYFNV